MDIEYKITLATKDDLLDVFNLSNDPIVRQNSFNQDQILIEDHTKWFNNKIADDNCIFYVVRDVQAELIGYARFDKDSEATTCIITIHLSRMYRNKGLGRKIIRETSDMALKTNKFTEVLAYIKENNAASLKSFLKAGYKLIGKDNINNNICYKLKLAHP